MITMFKNLRISQRLISTSIGALSIMAVGVLSYITYTSFNSSNEQHIVLGQANASALMDKIDRNYYERFGDVQAFAFNKLALQTAETDTMTTETESFINTMMAYYGLYDLMIICNKNGKVVGVNTTNKSGTKLTTTHLLGKDYSGEAWFKVCTHPAEGPEGGAWYSDFMVNAESGIIHGNKGYGMAYAAPIKNDKGEIVGVWYNFSNWAEVTQGIRGATEQILEKTNPGSRIIVTNERSEIIDAADDKLLGNKAVYSRNDFEKGSPLQLGEEIIDKENYDLGDFQSTGAFSYKGKSWNALVFVPKAAFNWVFFREKIMYFSIVLLLVVVAAAFVFYKMSDYISSNVRRVKDDIIALSEGNLVNIKIVESKDEIGQMTQALDVLSKGLERKSNFAKQIGSGNLNENFDSASNHDILGNSLLEMRKALVNTAEEDKKRNWTTEGLAKFADILRANSDDVTKFYDSIISNLVRYLNANQGGLYVLTESQDKNKYLELVSCYAFQKKKFVTKRIEAGEGLVGQCLLEGDTIYMTDVPEKYIEITSGLGDSNPRCILIVPLKINDASYGVVELASFKPYEKHQIEFVQKVGESIASTISSVKINAETKQLLEVSQQQAEEMRAQEEEMRQNLEEMQATQEEMQRKEMQMKELLDNASMQEAEIRQQLEDMRMKQEEFERREANYLQQLEDRKN